jgi:hypothetical protein
MTSKDEFKNKLRAKSEAAAVAADNFLKEDYDFLMQLNSTNLDVLIPKLTDRQKYVELIASIEESNKQNENVSQFQTRINTLGENGISLAKQLIKLVKS